MFKDITIVQSKYNKKQLEPKYYWHFAWHFKYRGSKYGNIVDNVKRDNNIFGTSFLGAFNTDPDRKLTCDVQILMLENMLEAMKGLREKNKLKMEG